MVEFENQKSWRMKLLAGKWARKVTVEEGTAASITHSVSTLHRPRHRFMPTFAGRIAPTKATCFCLAALLCHLVCLPHQPGSQMIVFHVSPGDYDPEDARRYSLSSLSSCINVVAHAVASSLSKVNFRSYRQPTSLSRGRLRRVSSRQLPTFVPDGCIITPVFDNT